MYQVGFAVSVGGKIMGICPLPLSAIEPMALRYKAEQAKHPEPKPVEIVPVFVGQPTRVL